jgi:hypothetical protein
MSSDESDDDLLASVPTFTRRSNRAAVNKTRKQGEKKMSFLDELAQDEEERAANELKIEAMMRADITTAADNAPHGGDSANMSGEEKENAASSRNNASALKKDLSNDIDWGRLEKEQEKNSSSARAKRRQEMKDTLDGIAGSPCASQNSSTHVNGGDYEERRKKKIASANAKRAGAMPKLGCRHVFNDPAKHNQRNFDANVDVFDAFWSEDEAIDCLKPTLAILAQESSSFSRRDRKTKLGVRKLVDCIQTVIDAESLPGYIRLRRIAIKSEQFNVTVPPEIQRWLWRVVCSPAKHLGADFVDGAASTLSQIMSVAEKSSTDMDSLKDILSLEHFFSLMITHFGLSFKKEAVDSDETMREINVQTSAGNNDLEASNAPLTPSRSATLKRVLDLWKLAFEKGLIRFQGDRECTFNHLSQLIEVVVKASLDTSFHSGVQLLGTVQETIILILKYADEHLGHHRGRENATNREGGTECNHPTLFDLWMTQTAARIVRQVSGLGPEPEGSEDNDDEQGYIAVSLAVQTVSMAPGTITVSDDDRLMGVSAQFKAAVAQEALRTLLGCSTEEWERKKWELVAKRCAVPSNDSQPSRDDQQEYPLRWHAVASAELSLVLIDEMKGVVVQNGPLFYSIVRIVQACIDGASTLFSLSDVDEDDQLCKFLDDTVDKCQYLKGKVSSAGFDAHFRRVKELLVNSGVNYKRTKMAIWDKKNPNTDTPIKKSQNPIRKSWMNEDR